MYGCMVQMDLCCENVKVVKMVKLLNVKVAKMLLHTHIYKCDIEFIIIWVWLGSLIYLLDIIKDFDGLSTPWNLKGKKMRKY